MMEEEFNNNIDEAFEKSGGDSENTDGSVDAQDNFSDNDMDVDLGDKYED